MAGPATISLKRRNAEVMGRAHAVLDRLDEADRLQRRVKWQALKAIIALRDMRAVATQTSSFNDRAWEEEYRLVESILLKISRRGV